MTDKLRHIVVGLTAIAGDDGGLDPRQVGVRT